MRAAPSGSAWCGVTVVSPEPRRTYPRPGTDLTRSLVGCVARNRHAPAGPTSLTGMSTPAREPFVLYEIEIATLELTFPDGSSIDVTETLKNGRANYILFQHLVAKLSGLTENSEGGASDLIDARGNGYEVKSYKDVELWPQGRHDKFHTAASSTFGPNNLGPVIRNLLRTGDYPEALRICRQTGFDKNTFYIYTNSSQYRPEVPFRYFVIPTPALLNQLSPDDPRQVNRRDLLAMLDRTEIVTGA
jgi:hypothetical protein